MGFSLTGSHIIYFIAAVIVAGTVSGVFIAVTMNVTTSLTQRGDRLQEELDIDFKIVNDPQNIPEVSNHYLFYLKNIGGKKFDVTNTTFQLFVNGEIVRTANYNISSSTVSVGDVTTFWVDSSVFSTTGDYTLRVVGPQGVEDEFECTIS